MRRRLPRQSEVRNVARPFAVLAVAEARAPDAGDARVPGQHLERLRLRDPDELPGFGAVADVVAVAVGEEVRGRAVDELEALLGDRLPVGRRNALAHDAAGDRGELVVDVGDALGVDLLPNVLHPLGTSFRLDEALQVRRHRFLLCSPALSCGSVMESRRQRLGSGRERAEDRAPDRRAARRARGGARRARGPAPQGGGAGDQDRARVRRPLRELRVPRCEERAGPARGADPRRCASACTTPSPSSTTRTSTSASGRSSRSRTRTARRWRSRSPRSAASRRTRRSASALMGAAVGDVVEVAGAERLVEGARARDPARVSRG